MKGILFKQCAPKSQMIFLMSVFCKWKFSIFQRKHLFRGCVLSKSAFVAVHLHFCYAIVPPVFSPWPPTLLYWIPIFAASILIMKAQSCKVLSTRNKQQRLLSTSSGLQVKREIQAICIFKTFAGREQEEGGAVTCSGNSPASPAAPNLFLVVRTAGATGQCIWWEVCGNLVLKFYGMVWNTHSSQVT